MKPLAQFTPVGISRMCFIGRNEQTTLIRKITRLQIATMLLGISIGAAFVYIVSLLWHS